ncbi:hypothetical protein STSP2_01241 [Anaerohalosphaera lusitana]|uniref:Uncharacterized protein n=1 Tax=Anaerohalosphaera lusitana TaxID=1936003 RepID=A0A1U9NKP0_9BACT|nr:hypothetical protein [Anaerohalosphaera lusitana]AQT68086.1 hypothetical protein STSP2_01241 [Anaerohalosphaera lusitana]
MLKKIAQIVSWICLAVLILPSALYLTGSISSLQSVKLAMIVATVVWFISAPLYMWKENG